MKRGLLAELFCLQVGRITHIRSKQDVKAAEAFAETDGAVVMDASDWQIIPAGLLLCSPAQASIRVHHAKLERSVRAAA